LVAEKLTEQYNCHTLEQPDAGRHSAPHAPCVIDLIQGGMNSVIEIDRLNQRSIKYIKAARVYI
jgi:hypothetical protein